MAQLLELEEQFVLRVLDPDLRDRLRAYLRQDQEPADVPDVQLTFEGSPGPPTREGTLLVDGTRYPVSVMDLPSVVEAYKTLDDINMIKIADVGQMLLVRPPGSGPLAERSDQHADGGDSGGSDWERAYVNRHGVTPPMRNAPGRVFRPRLDADPAAVAEVERAVLTIMQGGAPEGMKFVDVEEEYVVDELSGEGSWQPVQRR